MTKSFITRARIILAKEDQFLGLLKLWAFIEGEDLDLTRPLLDATIWFVNTKLKGF